MVGREKEEMEVGAGNHAQLKVGNLAKLVIAEAGPSFFNYQVANQVFHACQLSRSNPYA